MNIINSRVLEFLPHHLTILRNRFSARFHWFPTQQPSSIFSTTLNFFFGGGLLSQTPLQLELTQIWIVKYQRNLILGVLVKILLCNKRREIQRGISDLPPSISVLEFLFKKLIDIIFFKCRFRFMEKLSSVQRIPCTHPITNLDIHFPLLLISYISVVPKLCLMGQY